MCVCVFKVCQRRTAAFSGRLSLNGSGSAGFLNTTMLLKATAAPSRYEQQDRDRKWPVCIYHDRRQQLLHVDGRSSSVADGVGSLWTAITAAAQVVHQLGQDRRQLGAFRLTQGSTLGGRGVHVFRIRVTQSGRVLQQSRYNAGGLSWWEKEQTYLRLHRCVRVCMYEVYSPHPVE